MKIVVLVKEVPDTYEERKLDPTTGLADRNASERVLDEISERAIESALSYADLQPETVVTLLTMAPDGATPTLRKGLSMGAGSAMHVMDPALAGADALTTARVLAAALRLRGFDLVLAGDASTDGTGGAIPAMVAELLGLPHLTNVSSLTIDEGSVSGTRSTEHAELDLTAPLPAVVSITEALPDARFPNFKGIMAAKKKPIDVLTLAELSVTAPGDTEPQSIMLAVEERPARAAGTKLTDDGTAVDEIMTFLTSNALV